MGFASYLRDKVLPLVAWLCSIAAVALVLYAFALDGNAIVFICALLVAGMMVSLCLDYARRRSFYRMLADALQQLDESYLITELIDRPNFEEGALFYDALARATKAMNDAIGSYRMASNEYQEYIETWIHEVKTPIAAAHLIAENHGNSVVESINDEVTRIEGYVEQALFYSRSAAVEKDFSIKQEHLGALVREALRRNARMLIAAGMTPKLGTLDFTVLADAKWIVFVLGQILGNSAKYRKEADGAQQIVFIEARQYDAGLDTVRTVLSIRDNGVGIPASDVSRVFDKGFTGENGRMFAKSTGIGLYLCRQLCLKMGLGIALVSNRGEGTTINITFPQNRMHFIG